MTGPTTLPPLDEETIGRMEKEIFGRIRTDDNTHAHDQAMRRRRRNRWLGASAAAAVVIVGGIAIVPGLLPRGAASLAEPAIEAPAIGSADRGEGLPAELSDGPAAETFVSGSSAADLEASDAEGDTDGEATRDIVATATAEVTVDDPAAASATLTDLASDWGGYVEYSRGDVALDGDTPGAAVVSLRVPADRLDDALTALGTIGTVGTSEVDRRDVTQQASDLEARIDALSASVDRLGELMTDATSTSALLEAEEILTARQSELDAARQELARLDDQVSMSSLTVTLVTQPTVVDPDPAGFTDGLTTGWSGVIAVGNAIVVTVGFLLPWLPVVAVVIVLIWLFRRRARRSGPESDD